MVRRDGSVKVVKLSSIYQQQMSDIQMSTWTMASAGASRYLPHKDLASHQIVEVRDALTRQARLGRSIKLQAWVGDIGVRALPSGAVVSWAGTSPTRLGRSRQEACVIQTARDAPLAGAEAMPSIQSRSRNLPQVDHVDSEYLAG